MRIALTVLLLMSPQAVQAQSPAPQLQARHDALIAREAGGHAMAAYERQWVEAFRAGDPGNARPWAAMSAAPAPRPTKISVSQ